MKIDLDVRDGEANAFVRGVHSDQLPFATSLAVNRVALAFQSEERGHMADIFTVRRRAFMKGAVRIRRGDFATKQLPRATVRLDAAPSGPSRTDDIFAKFESETTKTPFGGGRSIAVPTSKVPRTGTGIIPKRFRPRALLGDAQQHGVGPVLKTRGNVFRGKQGAFLIRRPGGRGTIFRRVGADVFALYQLVPRVRINPELKFVDTARRVVMTRWATEFTRAFDQAMASATPGRIGPTGGIFAFARRAV